MCLLKTKKAGKILCNFIPLSIKGVPASKISEYHKNLKQTGIGFWTELVTPDKYGYFKNLNNKYFFFDISAQHTNWYKENEPIPLKEEQVTEILLQ